MAQDSDPLATGMVVNVFGSGCTGRSAIDLWAGPAEDITLRTRVASWGHDSDLQVPTRSKL